MPEIIMRVYSQSVTYGCFENRLLQRGGLNGQINSFLKIGDENLVEEQLKTAISSGGEELQKILKCVQKLNACISGSSTCFAKIRK